MLHMVVLNQLIRVKLDLWFEEGSGIIRHFPTTE